MSERESTVKESRLGETNVYTALTSVPGVVRYRFPWVKDPRGNLAVGEFEKEFPFRPQRFFIVSGVPFGATRGEHAHKQCHQLLICAQGQIRLLVDDGKSRFEVQLHQPNVGIYIPQMIWCEHCQYSADAALLVFASRPYDPADDIREYGAYLHAVGASS
jgi:UDP-2-acetamido-3-amino-2,3-dideoxy-glucuronate N-acetyltransferase